MIAFSELPLAAWRRDLNKAKKEWASREVRKGREGGAQSLAALRPLREPNAVGMRIAGAATSAAKMNCTAGIAAVSGLWLWVPGEGFVRWREIELQVEEAYQQWRRKKALQGVYIYDSEEARQTEITGGRGKGAVRRRWLREWSVRHAELERRAVA